MRKKLIAPDKLFFVIFGILALFALWRLVDLTWFIVDASDVEHAIVPYTRELDHEDMQRPFFPKHNCFTSYVIAQNLALAAEPNIYGPDLYRNPKRETPVHEEIGDLLTIDRYQYPPPFLLLPWILARIGAGFWGARTLFFLLNIAVFTLCTYCAYRWIGGSSFSSGTARRIGATWPLVLLAGTTLITLQMGNAHAFVMMLSILGMLAAVSNRNAIGGALLALTISSKIFPGLLLVYLLARGKRKIVAWTALFGAIYVAAAWLVFGGRPFMAFFTYQLERLAGGEAFSFAFTHQRALLANSSFTGIAYRVQQLGLIDEAGGIAKATTWIAGFVVLGCAWYWGRAWRAASNSSSEAGRYAELGLWLTLLALAQMRSPFLPWDYGSFVVLWLLAVLLVAPGGPVSWRVRALLLVPTWFYLSTALPLPFGGPTLQIDYAFAVVGTMLTLGLAVFASLHARTVLRGETPTS